MKHLLLALTACVFLSGCGKVVPPGKTILILKPSGVTAIVDQGVYRKWGRDKIYFVDKKLNSFAEDMQILCADDVNMAVDVKAVMSFRVDADTVEFIRNKVPSFRVDQGEITGQELSIDRFYEMAIRDIIRSSSRNVISKLTTDDIRPNREALEREIATNVRTRIEGMGYPIDVSAVLISNIEYPESVTRMREEIKRAQLEEQKQAAIDQMEIAKAKREVVIEQERAKVTIVSAQAAADKNRIMSESLTPAFLRLRQIEMAEELGRTIGTGGANTVYVMPYEAIGPGTMGQAMLQETMADR